MNHEDRLRMMLQQAGEALPEGPRLDRKSTIRKAKRDRTVHMVVAGVATAVIIALGAVTAEGLLGDDGLRPIPPGGPQATVEPSVEPTPTATTSPAASCSASGMSAEPSQQDLPPAVAELRSLIVEAAVACDYEELARLGLQGDGFSHSFGSSRDPARYWKKVEELPAGNEEPMAVLVATLDLPYCIEEATSAGVTLYAWPAVQCSTSTDNDYDDLAASGLYTEEEIRGFKQAGSFLGWRVGITEEGDWLNFTAGD